MIANIFSEHVTMEGTALVKQELENALRLGHKSEKRDNTVVQSIIDLHDKYLKYMKDVFQSDPLFDHALAKGFFFNL